MKPEKNADIIILGGGPAGMTAAIYAARANLATVIIEKEVCGGLVNSTHTVENFPSYTSINGMELMEKTLEQVAALGVEVEEVAEILNLSLTGEKKTIETEEKIYAGKAVILATGRIPVSLPIETDCEQIHYCSVCDGTAYKGKKILVVGGGNSGFDEAIYLQSLGVEEVTIIEMENRFFASQTTQDRVSSLENIDARRSTRIKKLIEDKHLKGVVLEDIRTGQTETVDVDGVFVFIGQKPNTGMFENALSLDENGYILADDQMGTSISGVFSAGDVNKKTCRQITTAMADGTIAALSAEKYIHRQ